MASDTSKNRFIKLTIQGLHDKGVFNEEYKRRLADEMMHIDVQGLYDYFLELYDKKAKFPVNEHNALTPWLLGLVDDFSLEQETAFNFGEFPDIDVDYLGPVRDYLKEDWALKQFGEENCCAIGNYTTFGIKSALIDMARVHGCDRNEIIQITRDIPLKDGDGNPITWDAAMDIEPSPLAAYCEEHPDVCEAARKLIDRNRGMGMHAGGLIISNQRIDKLVPLVRGKDNQHVSAFVEGLHGTDLGPLGLIKFDLLVITDLLRIVNICKMVRDRRGVTSIAALPGQSDFTDTSYLDDPKALELASKGHLVGIFQFDSPGIRSLVKAGGVTRFDDLCAYSALYRPGPLGMKMDKAYCDRKNNKEEYSVHPLLEPVLGTTYGILVFQEQVMKVLNIVGGIPLKDCEAIRKAISKKKVEQFEEYKEIFIKEGCVRLGWSEEQVLDLWNQIESFAAYGFNKSHTVAYTYISSRLLYLKAHYPHEFFTVTLQLAGNDKIPEYRLEAERCGITVQPLDLNMSKETFSILDNNIFLGFSDIKGIGEEVAKGIVEKQPYKDFPDFLNRFGTDANVIKPLLALRTFGDDPHFLYEFYELFKKEMKKRESRDARAEKSKEKYIDELRYVMMESAENFEENKYDAKDFMIWIHEKVKPESEADLHSALVLSDEVFETGDQDIETEQVPGLDIKETWKVYKKYKRTVERHAEKVAEDTPITLDSFEPTGEIDEKVKALLDRGKDEAQKDFYGFKWKHRIVNSPDFIPGRNFYQFDDETVIQANVQAEIKEVMECESQKGTIYYRAKLEDGDSTTVWVTFWSDDYQRFEKQLKKGNLISLKVLCRRDRGKPWYELFAPPRHKRNELPEPEADGRLILMTQPEEDQKPVPVTKGDEAVLEAIRTPF